MVDDAVDHHPLSFDPIFVVLVLHDGVLWVLGSSLLTLPTSILIFPSRTVVQTGGFIHVCLPLVVPVHDGVEDFQLEDKGEKNSEENLKEVLSQGFSPSHLELSDPGAVPVGLCHQLHEELPLGSAFHGWWWGGVWWSVRRWRNRDGRWWFSPSPVQNLLDPTFDWWTLGQDLIVKSGFSFVVYFLNNYFKYRVYRYVPQWPLY